jgi:DNA gyrase subunit B
VGDHRQRRRRGTRRILQAIEVTLRADGSVEVADNGRGIPVDVEPKTKLTGVEVVMTKLHAGGKFGGGSYAASGGLHGVGASVVNALSSRLDVEVDRGGKVHVMSFRAASPGSSRGTRETASFTKKGGLRIAGSCPRTRTGTRVRYWADRQIFTQGRRVRPARRCASAPCRPPSSSPG